MRSIKIIKTIIVCACGFAFAQQSPLGLTYPLGVPENAVTGSAAAMGGAGVGIADDNFGAALNIANAGMDGRAAFSALVSLDFTTVNDNGNTASVSGYSPKLLSLIIPIGSAGNLAFAMQNQYNANLNFFTRDTVSPSPPYTRHITTIELHRLGGLTAWQAGWAKRFGNGIALGVGYERLFYSSDARNEFESFLQYEDFTREDSTGAMINTPPPQRRFRFEEKRVVDFASNAFRFGLQFPVNERFTLGVAGSYVVAGNNNATQSTSTQQQADSSDVFNRPDDFPILTVDTARGDTTRIFWDTTKFSVDLPPTFSFGASYAPTDQLLLAADVGFTLWELFEADGGGFASDIRNTYALSFGARFIPAGKQMLVRYYEQISYSAGFRYETLPHGGGGGLTDAYEYAFTFGLGLPIPNDGGLVDIVFQAGQRQDARFSGYSENVYKIQVGLNGGRSWFQRGEN